MVTPPSWTSVKTEKKDLIGAFGVGLPSSKESPAVGKGGFPDGGGRMLARPFKDDAVRCGTLD